MLAPKPIREGTMRVRTVLLAASLVLAPLGTRAADLVVWWEEGYHPREDQAVRELVAAFELKTGKRVELAFHSLEELPGRTSTAVAAGSPPDFAFSQASNFTRWAYEGQLVDLADALGPLTAQFDRDALERATLLDATTGKR